MSAAPVVVKYGGSLLEDPLHREEFLRGLAAFPTEPRLILVHGGGKEISRQMERAGLVPRFVGGRRYTDNAALAVVETALRELNADIVQRLQTFGRAAKGYSGRDQHLLEATVVPELGRVGLPTKVSDLALAKILAQPELPVFYSIAEDAAQAPLNINADDFALALAAACHASHLVFLTDTGGLLGADGQVISRIDPTEAERLISDGTISGGMTVKVRACLEALQRGIGAVELAKDLNFLTSNAAPAQGTRITVKTTAAR